MIPVLIRNYKVGSNSLIVFLRLFFLSRSPPLRNRFHLSFPSQIKTHHANPSFSLSSLSLIFDPIQSNSTERFRHIDGEDPRREVQIRSQNWERIVRWNLSWSVKIYIFFLPRLSSDYWFFVFVFVFVILNLFNWFVSATHIDTFENVAVKIVSIIWFFVSFY